MSKYIAFTPEQRIAAFWNKVNKDGSVPAHMPHLGKCWEWTAAKHKQGYGIFGRSNERLAHRISWILINGKIPNNLFVLHSCDNPSCVNPDHLFLGTDLDNAQDRDNKARCVWPKGEKHSCSKLTDKQVLEIREIYASGHTYMRILSAKYKISISQISRIIRHETRINA